MSAPGEDVQLRIAVALERIAAVTAPPLEVTTLRAWVGELVDAIGCVACMNHERCARHPQVTAIRKEMARR